MSGAGHSDLPHGGRATAGSAARGTHEGPKRAVVAMSGGVDSSVAAALLVKQGFEVIGLMLHLWSEPGDGARNRCCTIQSVKDARQVARALGITFRVLNCARRFKTHVVDYFVTEYAAGRTPNPCLACNRLIKFGYLLDLAQTLGADYVATGHYARVQYTQGHYKLLRGIDRDKDQSYVLYMLGQAQLARLLFPLGAITKDQVRTMAREWNLPVAEKAESQDVCFVRDQDYRRFLRAYAPEALRPGPIEDRSGRRLGEHQGLPLYTIGQRRGIGVAGPEALYVLKMDPTRNALIVGPARELGRQRFQVRDASFVSGGPPPLPTVVTAMIRYRGHEVGGTLNPGEAGQLDVQLDQPVRGVTPGQATVFYRGEVVVGGGIIAEPFAA